MGKHNVLNATTHGRSYRRVYSSWRNMNHRCRNPKHKAYPAYGGKGISVCEKWQKFGGFFEDMGDPPTEEHSIDRIDNSLGYFKENCRWATTKQQLRNYSRCRFIEHDGRRMTVTDWANELGVNRGTLGVRLRRGQSLLFAASEIKRHRKIQGKQP